LEGTQPLLEGIQPFLEGTHKPRKRFWRFICNLALAALTRSFVEEITLITFDSRQITLEILHLQLLQFCHP
jgi:hypothetical protein